jgi:hypothetical protein
MATLRALLEVFGSLDTAVINSNDPRVGEIADLFIPGTSSNTEWYRELEAFMVPVADEHGNGARTEANAVDALKEINFDRTQETRPPTIPELSRLVYAIGAIIRIKSVVPSAPLPRLDDPVEENDNWNLLGNVLALAGPDAEFTDNRARLDDTRLNEVTELIANGFTSWRAWYDVSNKLAAMGVLKAEIAAVPLCQAAVVTVNGIESVVVDTEFSSSDVSLNMLKRVVDPRNWASNYPSFFCKMEDKGLRADKWRKVKETVGFCYLDEPFGRRLVTKLKFHKTTTQETGLNTARLDYDLNDPVPDDEGDGQITVDRGFINMWTAPGKGPTDKGVFVRTRKVAHINGLRPYTMKRFVCIFGYAYGTIEMLFGSAQYPDMKFPYAEWDEPVEDPTHTVDPTPAKPPGQSNNTAVSTAIKIIADCANDLSVKNLDLIDSWMSGKLTVDELANYSTEVGARLASDPWKLIRAITKAKGGNP